MNTKINKKIALAVVSVLTLSSCAQMKKHGAVIGSIGGAIVGQYIGKKVGGNSGKHIGMFLGGLAGAAIGKHLSEQENEALRKESAIALADAQDGQKIIWRSAESNARATITPSNTRKEVKKVKMLKDKNLVVVPNMKLIGKEYESTVDKARIRNEATTNSGIIMHLHKGQPITAVGEVVGQPWIMIAINGISVGYVHKSLIKEANQQIVATVREPLNLDDMDLVAVNQNARQTINLDNIEVVKDDLIVITDCRTIDLDIVSDKGSESSQLNSCKGIDGNWDQEVA